MPISLGAVKVKCHGDVLVERHAWNSIETVFKYSSGQLNYTTT